MHLVDLLPATLRRTAAIAVASAVVVSSSACAGAPDDTAEAGPIGSSTAVATPTTVPPTTAPTTTTTLPAPTAPPTTAPPVPPSVALSAPCSADLVGEVPGPVPASASLTAALADRLDDPRFDGVQLAASVWVQGFGEVVAVDADELLIPASGQKLVTAAGALTGLDPYATFATSLVATGPVVDGVVRGDLVLVGGDDPSLTIYGIGGLEGLVSQARAAGVVAVEGDLVVAGGVQAADGTGIHAAGPALAELLAGSDVAVAGQVIDGPAPAAGFRLGAVGSAPVWQLVNDMLLSSNNLGAESLVRVVGRATRGDGTTAAGLAAAHQAASDALCVDLPGTSVDGSGLSRDNRHSARSLRRLVQALLPSPWGYQLHAGLPVGGWSGTLLTRFAGTAAEGNVHAKTGSLNGVASLTGYVHTASGRLVVFSIIVNGPGAEEATDAIDELVVALAADAS